MVADMSTSLKVVSIAAVFCASFSRSAMRLRSRVIFTRCSRAEVSRGAAARRCIDLERDLVRLQLDQRLVDRPRLADLLQPPGYGRLGHRFAQRGHLDFRRHGVSFGWVTTASVQIHK